MIQVEFLSAAGRKLNLAIIILLGCYSLVLIFITRYHFLDDAYIHLRIAKNLVDHGFYSFNGDIPTFSTSSPFYTALLSSIWIGTHQILLPKYVNLVVYFILFALISIIAIKRAYLISLLWLIAVTSPIGIRWLTDGMETGLVAVFGVCLGALIHRLASNDDLPFKWSVGLVYLVMGLISVTLRVEFLFILASSVLAWIICTYFPIKRCYKIKYNLTFAYVVLLAIGAGLGVVIIYATFGYMLPDTAVAKAAKGHVEINLFTDLIDFVRLVVMVHFAASLFGVGVGLCFLLSIFKCLLSVKPSGGKGVFFILNVCFIVFLALIFIRHQALQGYRYFVAIEFFLLTYNIMSLPESKSLTLNGFIRNNAVLLVVISLVVSWNIFDFSRLQIISSGRSRTFHEFADKDIKFLSEKNGVAWDVGMIGFFSDGRILDPNGLVNGRDFADKTSQERLDSICRDDKIDFVFANMEQLRALNKCLDTNKWTTVNSYDFPNFNGQPDTHYLIVRPDMM